MMNKMKRIPLTSEAYQIIKRQIIDLHLRPGEIFIVQSLAKKLGFSRTPVREALVRLKQEGLVESAEGGKFKVTEITLKSILEIYDIREVLECQAIRHVAARIQPYDAKELRKIQDDMASALKAGDNDAFFINDLSFHQCIIRIYGNKTLEWMLEQLNDRVQRIRYLTRNIHGRMEATIEEHSQILECLENKDPEGAQRCLLIHLSNVRRGIETLFGEANSYLAQSLLERQVMA